MKGILYIFKQNCYEELDKARELKEDCNYSDSFGIKITCTTREKIFRTAIIIMKYIKDHQFERITKLMPLFVKRVKLHINQLKKLKCSGVFKTNHKNNQNYFKNLIRFFYTCCIDLKEADKFDADGVDSLWYQNGTRDTNRDILFRKS